MRRSTNSHNVRRLPAHVAGDNRPDEAMELLARAFRFEIVERCPGPCPFCDQLATTAA